MNIKKILLISVISIVIVLIGFVVVLKFAFSDWTDGTIKKSEEVIISSLDDKFLFQYETRNFPDYETKVTIMDPFKKDTIVNYVIEGNFVKPNLIVQVNVVDLRCYEVNECIIYSVKQGTYRGINKNIIADTGLDKDSDLIIVARALVAKKEWKWIKICGSFLLNVGNDDMKKTLERYALGQFLQEELDLNINSKYKKEDMQVFAKQVLEQK